MRAIFISYRRDDAEGQAGRLFGDLTQHFGDDAVFMDVAAIEPGRDFRRAIDEQVASCGVLLAIIGKSWLTAKDESGARRLDDPMDFVRLETASALKRDIPVVPVLVHAARMPRVEDLPEDLKELAFRNGVELTHARWDSDVQVLVKALRPYVQAKQEPTWPRPPSAPSEPGPTRKGSSRMIIAAVVGMLVLACSGYVWHQKASEDAALETAAQKEATRLAAAAKEEQAKAKAQAEAEAARQAEKARQAAEAEARNKEVESQRQAKEEAKAKAGRAALEERAQEKRHTGATQTTDG
jgi:flagellar biosynthesis GTPase FlhF